MSGRYIAVYVHPRARQRRMELRGENRYEVWVPEVPADGAANKAVQRLLAEALTVAPLPPCAHSGSHQSEKGVSADVSLSAGSVA